MLCQQMAQASAGSAAKSFQTFLETITNSVVSLLALLLKANRRYGWIPEQFFFSPAAQLRMGALFPALWAAPWSRKTSEAHRFWSHLRLSLAIEPAPEAVFDRENHQRIGPCCFAGLLWGATSCVGTLDAIVLVAFTHEVDSSPLNGIWSCKHATTTDATYYTTLSYMICVFCIVLLFVSVCAQFCNTATRVPCFGLGSSKAMYECLAGRLWDNSHSRLWAW